MRNRGWALSAAELAAALTVTLSAAAAVTLSSGPAFAIDDCTPCGGASIAGTVFNDLDGNGYQNGEPGLVGQTVSLLDGRGQVVGTATTGAGGTYSFPGLACGNYLVMVDIPGGWTQTSPGLNTGFYDVHLGTQGATYATAHFGIIQASCTGGDLDDVVNSGWDEGGGFLLGGAGTLDDDWLLTASYPISTCLNGAGLPVVQHHLQLEPSRDTQVINAHTAWDPAEPDATWVSSWPGNPQPNGEHFYQHCFCLAGGFSNPQLDFSYVADDKASVSLNGTLIYSNTASNNFNQGTSFPLPSETIAVPASAWRVGMNCLTVEVENIGAVVTGFSLNGSITADDGQCCQALVEPGAVKGVKYWDQDGNGTQGSGEPTLTGWPIEFQDGFGNTLMSTTTDSSGGYGFTPITPGVWEIHEGAAPSGSWVQTEPTSPDHHDVTLQSGQTQTGYDFGNDGDICDVLDIVLSPAFSESPMDCCVNVQVDNRVVDYFVGVDVQSPFAPYGVVDYTPYTYQPGAGGGLFEAAPFVPVGFTTVGTMCFSGGGSVPGPHGMFAFVDQQGNPFCEVELACGATIDGHKYNDEDANGTQDLNETGMGGWVIELVDVTTGLVVATTTTAPDGSYSFPGVPVGTYIVREVQQTGWIQTEPATPGEYNVSVDTQQNYYVRGLAFGNTPDPVNSTGGGTDECAELTNESIVCEDALTWTWSATLTNLSDIPAAEVVVQHVTPTNIFVSPANYPLPTVLGSGDSATVDFTLSANQAPPAGTEVCFFLTLHDALGLECCSVETCVQIPHCSDCLNAIHGVKYHDKNANGVRDPNEGPLANWQINLQAPDGTVTSVTTDVWGNYWFTDLPHGVYTVWETQQTGWYQYEPTTSAYTVTLAALGGEVITDLNFGNSKKKPADPIDPHDPTGPTGPTGPTDPADATATAEASAGEAAPVQLVQAKENVALLSFEQPAPEDEGAILSSVTLAATGSGDAARGLTEIRLVHDLDRDGEADAYEPVLASGTFGADQTALVLVIEGGHGVPAGANHQFVIAGDFGASQGAGAAAGPVVFGGSDSGPADGAPVGPPLQVWLLFGLVAGVIVMAGRIRKLLPAALAAAALSFGACAGGALEEAPTYQVHLIEIDAVGAESGVRLGLNGKAVVGPQFQVGG